MKKITAALVIIGNEVLSGRTQDTNVQFIAKKLMDLGIELIEVRMVPDEQDKIVDAVNALRSQVDYLFTTGGIGATHDDITAAAIAKAFNRNLVINTSALKILKDGYGDRFNEIRARMARMPEIVMPEDVKLINNPISVAPSFSIENVYVLAGMPSVMKGMLECVLPTLKRGKPFFSNSITCNLVEGQIAQDLELIQERFPTVSIGSYPFYRLPPDIGVCLVMKGQDPDSVSAATEAVLEMIHRFDGTPVIERQI